MAPFTELTHSKPVKNGWHLKTPMSPSALPRRFFLRNRAFLMHALQRTQAWFFLSPTEPMKFGWPRWHTLVERTRSIFTGNFLKINSAGFERCRNPSQNLRAAVTGFFIQIAFFSTPASAPDLPALHGSTLPKPTQHSLSAITHSLIQISITWIPRSLQSTKPPRSMHPKLLPPTA